MNKNEKIALLLNIVLVCLGIVGTLTAFSTYGIGLFVYYTVDSNILCLVSSILYVIFLIIKKKQQDMPLWVMITRFMATVCLMVTFIVVVAYLAPVEVWVPGGGYFANLKILLFQGDMLYQHLLCPVISFISFGFFEGDRRLNKKKTIWLGTLATLIYGTILIVLNVLNVVNGPYPFFRISENPVGNISVMAAVIVLSYSISRFILLLNQKHSPRLLKNKDK